MLDGLLRIGINYDEFTHEYLTGCMNAFAAGALIYISLVEMIAEDFSDKNVTSNPSTLKLCMVVAFAVGMFCMAILGIWA